MDIQESCLGTKKSSDQEFLGATPRASVSIFNSSFLVIIAIPWNWGLVRFTGTDCPPGPTVHKVDLYFQNFPNWSEHKNLYILNILNKSKPKSLCFIWSGLILKILFCKKFSR